MSAAWDYGDGDAAVAATWRESLPARMTGAIIDDVEIIGSTLIRVSFHRGADRDAGWITVAARMVLFEEMLPQDDGGEDD